MKIRRISISLNNLFIFTFLMILSLILVPTFQLTINQILTEKVSHSTNNNNTNNQHQIDHIKIPGQVFLTKQQMTSIYQKIFSHQKQYHQQQNNFTCKPFYKRLFYNQNNIPEKYKIINQQPNKQNKNQQQLKSFNLKYQPSDQFQTTNKQTQLPIDMLIYFNTNISCPRSYVTVQFANLKIMKFQCSQNMIHLEDKNNTNITVFKQWVHKCRVFIQPQQAKYVYDFKYMIYGQAVTQNLQEQKTLQENYLNKTQYDALKTLSRQSELIQVQLIKRSLPLRMLVLGDWAPIFVRPYFPIHQSLYHLIQLRREQRKSSFANLNKYRIGGLYIVGDIAYNLQDFNGMKYNWFMSQMEKVSPYWPILIIPGNHDDNTMGNKYMLTNSFDIGKLSLLDTNSPRVKWMRFPGQLNMIQFDPFWEIYKQANDQQTALMVDYFKAVLDQIQSKYPDEFTIATSHYPVICSQMDDAHCNGMTYTNSMKQLLNLMSTPFNGRSINPVDFYIGSHMHQYQRAYPYNNGKFIITPQNNSTYSRGQMTNVVQGVAGCDYGIISQDYARGNFSITATYAKTGYGFMSIQGTTDTEDKTKFTLNYKHLVAKPAPEYYENVDQFTIYTQLPKKEVIEQKSQIDLDVIYNSIDSMINSFFDFLKEKLNQ